MAKFLGTEKKKEKKEKVGENSRKFLALRTRTKHLGTFQFDYMDYTFSTQPVTMPAEALEHTF